MASNPARWSNRLAPSRLAPHAGTPHFAAAPPSRPSGLPDSAALRHGPRSTVDGQGLQCAHQTPRHAASRRRARSREPRRAGPARPAAQPGSLAVSSLRAHAAAALPPTAQPVGEGRGSTRRGQGGEGTGGGRELASQGHDSRRSEGMRPPRKGAARTERAGRRWPGR